MIRYLQVVDKIYRLIVFGIKQYIIISNELNNEASKKALNK